ncbi:uncharacterized protein [Clytia hemisphaerica]|uniref:uncharacterized protein n=1 Tax=Clytia hemisphaerica TaxID=252671 RepID=UPI0034D4F915
MSEYKTKTGKEPLKSHRTSRKVPEKAYMSQVMQENVASGQGQSTNCVLQTISDSNLEMSKNQEQANGAAIEKQYKDIEQPKPDQYKKQNGKEPLKSHRNTPHQRQQIEPETTPQDQLIQDPDITSNTESEIDSATEKRLLESTDLSETEGEASYKQMATPKLAASPLRKEEILRFKLGKTRYKFDDLNSYEYWREVRTVLATNMGRRERLTGHYYLNFDDHFEPKGGVKCRIPKPEFDAWCLVKGKVREGFDIKGFCLCYPNIEEELKRLRTLMTIIVNRPPINS